MYKLVLILIATIAFSLVIFNPMTSIAQQPTTGGQSSGQPQGDVPLSFFLKMKNSKNASSTERQGQNATVSVTIEKGPGGNPVKLPVSAKVPKGTQAKDLELCAKLKDGNEMCQSLDKTGAKIDLSAGQNQSSGSSSNMTSNSSKPAAFIIDSSPLTAISSALQGPQVAAAQLISINNTTLNIPITVIVPITLEIQNAQICASVASSGDQTCQQIVLNPVQTAYTPVDIDLSTGGTPTISTGSTTPIQTTNTGSNSTSAGTGVGNDTTPSTNTGSTPAGTTGSNETSSSMTANNDDQKAKNDKNDQNKGQDKKSEDTTSDSGSDTGTN